MRSTGPQDMEALIAAFIGQGLVSNITVIGIPLDGRDGGLNELFGDGGHDGLFDLRGLDGLDVLFSSYGLEALLAALVLGGSSHFDAPLDDPSIIEHAATCPNCREHEGEFPPELQMAVMNYRIDHDPGAIAWFASRRRAAA